MPQEKIIIKFEAKDANKLINAIDRLTAAQKNLQKGIVKTKVATGGATAANSKLAQSQHLVEQRMSSNAKTANVLQGAFATLRNKLLLLSFATVMVVKPLLDLIKAQSDAEEIANKFNVVFGRQADVVRDWAGTFGQSVGRASSELQGMLATLQDTFVPLGFARKEATKLSISLTTLALDVASFNNKLDADVIRDFQSALVGNHETVRKYGIVITEAQLAAEALRSGIIETKRELTSQEKVQARLNLIVAGSKDAIGDLERTQDSYANTLKRFNAEVRVTQEELGKALIPLATELLGVMTNLAIHFRDTDAIRNYALFLGGVAISMSGVTAATFSLAGALAFLRTAMIRTGVGALAVGLGYLAERFLFAKDSSEDFSNEIEVGAIKTKQAAGIIADLVQEFDDYEKALRATSDAQNTEEAQMSDWIRTMQDVHKAENDILKVKQRLEIASVNAIAIDGAYIARLKLGNKQSMERIVAEQQLVIVKNQLTEASEQEQIGLLAEQASLEQLLLHYQKLHPLEVQALINKQNLTQAQKDKIQADKDEAKAMSDKAKNQAILNKSLGSLSQSMVAMAKGNLDQTVMALQLGKAQGIMNIIVGATQAVKSKGWIGFIEGAAIMAQGMAMIANIDTQIASAKASASKMEQGGLIGGRRHSQGGTMINAEQGEFVMSRSAVDSVGIENLNRMNEGGGGGSVTVNVSGNVLSQDFVEGELAENIKEAIRRGTDFGIS